MSLYVVDIGKPAGEMHSREVCVVWVSPADAESGITLESLLNQHSDYSAQERAEFAGGGVWEMNSAVHAVRFAEYLAGKAGEVIYINRY